MPPVKMPGLACQAPCPMANYVTRRTIRASLTYTVNRLDPSSIQNITLGVLAIFIALATLVVAYLQYKRSASREHPAVTVEQERSVITSNGISTFISIS
ncbi:hypothetical protein V2W45_1337864 [Cenococcum geophilum]